MAPLVVPESGLVLSSSSPEDDPGKDGTVPPQFMQLELEDGMLLELIKSARNGGKSPHLSCGKTISLQYGTRTRVFSSTPASSPNLLYTRSAEDVHQFTLAGRLSHKLALQKAQTDVAGADEALAKLQNSLASAEQAKQSNQIKYVPDSSSLPPPIKQTAATLKHQSSSASSLSFLKKNKHPSRLDHSSTRSMPSSPSSGPFRPPVFSKAPPRSNPASLQGKVQRIQAIRQPLIHLLAVRPLSAKFLAQQINCKHDDILEVLSKVGKTARLDESKYDLHDRVYKDLDVWAFAYPDQHDRDLAIDRSVSAFDRLRVSRTEAAWQKLNAKHERGKGKTLSRLDHLQKGPIQQSNTPKIHVQQPDEPSKQSTDRAGEERKQLALSDSEPMARSKSHEGVKKSKVSEKEAQSKRLLSNGPKKFAATVKERDPHPAVKKGVKKVIQPLSSEFVNESDEEDGLEDAMASHANASTPKEYRASEGAQSTPVKGVTSKVVKPKLMSRPSASTPIADGPSSNSSKPSTPAQARSVSKSKPSGSTTKPAKEKIGNGVHAKGHGQVAQKAPEKKLGASTPSISDTKRQTSDASQGGTPMKKSLSRPRNISSPHKPSPLGSSPPTNASDLDQPDLSSASSTPLMSQLSKQLDGVNGHVRNTSEHSLKRKAGDLDENIHDHISPFANGHVNGRVKPKRQKTSELTPPSSDSLSPPSPQTARNEALEKAQRFKDYYPKYEKMYREVAASLSPTAEKLKTLERMHRRLVDLKAEIVSLVKSMSG